MKKCLIIYNEPGPEALPDELDVLDQVNFIRSTIESIGHHVDQKGITDDIFHEIAAIANEKPDYVFNLVESVCKKGEILYFVPALLNMHHIPYTGCPLEATFITASKVLTRRFMKTYGIPVADGFKVSEANKLIPGKKYILKPVWEDGSIGITEESVFTFDGKLPEILKGKNDEHWFIEEYIDGREFNVSVLGGPDGPEVMPPAEMIFHNYSEDIPRIVSYKAKWMEGTFQYENSRRNFPTNLSEKLLSGIRNAALGCWTTFGLKGYARVDMRVDSDENVYVLEVNANPCISPDSGFISAGVYAGYTHAELVGRIINDLNNQSNGRGIV
jgi:D-alanine-D-alanine ligase